MNKVEKVYCFYNEKYKEYFDDNVLTDGRIYEARFNSSRDWITIDELDSATSSYMFIYEWCFISLAEWRDIQINGILYE